MQQLLKTMSNHKKIASNRRALRDYQVEERLEAGIELRGTEVKSVREGHVTMTGAFAAVQGGECILTGLNIATYEYGNRFNHDPERDRRLLLHKKEISKIKTFIEAKGYSAIPLSIYLKKGLVKVELGLCRGKKNVDKRETLKRRTADREAERAMKRR